MLKIERKGYTLSVTGEKNPFYPNNGTLTYPMNSVALMIDNSDMIVFKSSENGDVLFTAMLKDITIAGEAVTKEDIAAKFDKVATINMAGPSEGAVLSVNGKEGVVVLTANDLNAYTKDEVNGLIPSTDNFATKEELNSKANTSDIADMATQSWVGQQNYLTSVPEEYVTETELQGKNFATKTELGEKANTSDLAAKQDKLVSGTNIATINNQDITKGGNITISGGKATPVEDNLTSESTTSALSAKQGKVLNDTKADKSELTNLATKEDLKSKADASAISDMATQTWVGQQNYLKSVPSEYVTDDELTQKNFATKDELPSLVGYATEEWVGQQKFLKEIPSEYVTETELQGKDFATKTELGEKANTSDLAAKQDTLVSGVNIATVNGQSLLQGKDIVVEGGKVAVDAVLSTESENPVQNKVITTELSKKLVESVTLTQSEYNQLVEKKPNTIYVISDAPELATQAWVLEQIKMAIGTIEAKVAEINNKII